MQQVMDKTYKTWREIATKEVLLNHDIFPESVDPKLLETVGGEVNIRWVEPSRRCKLGGRPRRAGQGPATGWRRE